MFLFGTGTGVAPLVAHLHAISAAVANHREATRLAPPKAVELVWIVRSLDLLLAVLPRLCESAARYRYRESKSTVDVDISRTRATSRNATSIITTTAATTTTTFGGSDDNRGAGDGGVNQVKGVSPNRHRRHSHDEDDANDDDSDDIVGDSEPLFTASTSLLRSRRRRRSTSSAGIVIEEPALRCTVRVCSCQSQQQQQQQQQHCHAPAPPALIGDRLRRTGGCISDMSTFLVFFVFAALLLACLLAPLDLHH